MPLAAMHGTYTAGELIGHGIVNVMMQRHLTDNPTSALLTELAGRDGVPLPG